MGSVKQKVICLGLARTGTTSLLSALGTLGFGPCYTMRGIVERGDPKELDRWYNVGQASYAIVDVPPAMYFKEVYEAYPDAKFILTTRDPAKWEASMRATVIEAHKRLRTRDNLGPLLTALNRWMTVEQFDRYHEGKLETDPQGEFLRHNQRVLEFFPADKLLVYEVTQGWGPLTEFLGVETPDIPFPHVMDTAEFQNFAFSLIEIGNV